MSWEIIYLTEVKKNYENLTHRQQLIVDKSITKVQKNPLPQNEGSYGKPLGHKPSNNLTGFLKIKLQSEVIRIVYKLIRTETKMQVVVIGIRENEEVYEISQRKIQKHNL